MTLPRDYARCLGAPDNPLCQGCARYTKNNQDPEGERVVFIRYSPTLERSYRKRNHPDGWVQSGWSEFWACDNRIP